MQMIGGIMRAYEHLRELEEAKERLEFIKVDILDYQILEVNSGLQYLIYE